MYTNPILNRDFADPSILRASDGWLYLYGTRSYERDNTTNIQCARSKNAIDWEYLPDVLPVKPVWAKNTREFWAPYTLESNGIFFLYFSTEQDTRDGMGIGVAYSSTPTGPFTDSGHPLIAGESFTTIDPFVFPDPVSGKIFFYWGSGHSPIWGMEMNSDYVSLSGQYTPSALIQASANYELEKLVEGAFLIFHHKWYYLFYSGDNVWEPDHYAVMVARSKSPLGPFEKMAEQTGKSNSIILRGNMQWNAPGQCSIFADEANDPWMIYHAVATSQRMNEGTSDLRRVVLIDKIEFEAEWPKIGLGTPSITPQKSPCL